MTHTYLESYAASWTFIAGLTPDPKAEAVALIKLVETLGNKLREPHSKALGDGLFELRRNQVRLFYMFEPGQVVSGTGFQPMCLPRCGPIRETRGSGE